MLCTVNFINDKNNRTEELFENIARISQRMVKTLSDDGYEQFYVLEDVFGEIYEFPVKDVETIVIG